MSNFKFPYQNPELPIEARVDDLMGRMTLVEKIGQMTQVEKNSISPLEVGVHCIGSVLSGGGGNPLPNNLQTWRAMVCSFQAEALKTRLGIPILYGVDAVHGHSNMVGAVIFPHNIGLGAARDPEISSQVGYITALEMLAAGVHWDFAPAVSVPQDLRWGRTFEGFSEDPSLVSELGAAFLRGLQGGESEKAINHHRKVLGCPKHFVGDGGTKWGSANPSQWIAQMRGWISTEAIDQGITDIDEKTLREIHLAPYITAIAAGARNIMVSYSSWDGLKMHAQSYLLTDVLKGELGFKGFLVSDWKAIDQIDPDYYKCVVQSINAGLDMIMVPFDYLKFLDVFKEAVARGDISLERVNDAVRRILDVKFEFGLFEYPFGDSSLMNLVGSADHRQVAREAVQRSLVLLKNELGALPIAKDVSRLYLAGLGVDDIGLQCGGWTIDWMGRPGPITPGTTLLSAVRKMVSPQTEVLYVADGEFDNDLPTADVGLIVVSEPPYAEGTGDRADLRLPEADAALIKKIRSKCKKLVVLLFSGRPLVITDYLEDWDAFVAAWLPGTEGQGIADVLFGDVPFQGKLSYAWPRRMEDVPLGTTRAAPLFPLGYGLTVEIFQ